jgi:hypothetical protein
MLPGVKTSTFGGLGGNQNRFGGAMRKW